MLLSTLYTVHAIVNIALCAGVIALFIGATIDLAKDMITSLNEE